MTRSLHDPLVRAALSGFDAAAWAGSPFLAPERVFPAAVRLARWGSAPLDRLGLRPQSNLESSYECVLLNQWLRAFAGLRAPFPVPADVDEEAELRRLHASAGALLFCSAHYLGNLFLLRSVTDWGWPLAGVSIRPVPLWGLGRAVERIEASAHCLSTVRRALVGGTSVVLQIDERLGADERERPTIAVSSRPFQLARRAGVPLVFFRGELREELRGDLQEEPRGRVRIAFGPDLSLNAESFEREARERFTRLFETAEGPRLVWC